MQKFLVRMEAVNLASSIYDTDDLSTVRGGSFAALELPKALMSALHLKLEPIFTGASQAVAIAEVEDDVAAADIEAAIDRLCVGNGDTRIERRLAEALPFVGVIGVAVPFGGDYSRANAVATARLRRKQMTRPTVDIGARPTAAARHPCQIDRMRPATADMQKGEDHFRVSQSVLVRRKIGKSSRRGVYGPIAASIDGLDFVDSFLELVSHPPKGLMPSLLGKMAVIKLDGNKFSGMRDRFISGSGRPDGSGRSPAAIFSDKVTSARLAFLDRLIGMVKTDPQMKTPEERLRFETLLWGGDESMFVMPAWKVRDLLDAVAADMGAEHWDLQPGLRLTTSYAILICSAKMPIANAKNLAEAMLASAKKLNVGNDVDDRLTMQLIESIDAPAGDVDGLRKQLYHTDNPAAFTVSGKAKLLEYLGVVDLITDPAHGLPRSQLQDLLVRSRAGEAILDDPKSDRVKQAVMRSRGGDAQGDGGITLLDAALRNSLLGVVSQEPGFPYQRLAELWDLLRPFGERGFSETA